MDYCDRNIVWGFSRRTLTNLRFMVEARASGAEVHVVTELITSLLGLIVLPYEQVKRQKYAKFQTVTLASLEDKGWPKWHISLGTSQHLEEHLRHVRNALSHRNVVFSSDSRDLDDVMITFRDRPRHGQPFDWESAISGDGLYDFVCRFALDLQQWERDYS